MQLPHFSAHRLQYYFLAITMSLLLIAALPTSALARSLPDFADLSEELLPSVVNISTTQESKQPSLNQQMLPPGFPQGSPFEQMFRDFFEQMPNAQPRRTSSLGSGFIIDSSGLIVTNNHVIDGADAIKVILNDNTELDATVVGSDAKTDLALLQVTSKKPLPALRWGNSDDTRVGEWVLTIGNPFGLGGTVTSGIISARARDINAGPYDDFFQTDAAINRGNSGGPLFNLNGEVIGINTAIFSPTGGSVGIGFAIPANLARPVLAQIQEFGRTKRGWLGVQIQPVTPEIAESFSMTKPTGALVANVNADGPAAKAGIKAGDIILEFDGRTIEEMRMLPRAVAETAVGKATRVTILREGKQQTVRVTLGELEAAEEAMLQEESSATPIPNTKTAVAGMQFAPLNDVARERYEIPANISGVLVSAVEQYSEAAQKGIQAGDVILEANRQRITDSASLNRVIEIVRQSERKLLLLRVHSKRAGAIFVALKVE